MAPTAQAGSSYIVSDVQQIAALASPVRQDIIDTLQVCGPSPVAALATTLRRPAAGLYYHIEQLEAVGLLRSTVKLDSVGRTALLLELPGEHLALHYDPADARNRAAIVRVIATMLRSALRAFRRAFLPKIAVVDGPRRNLWAGRMSGALNLAELEEFNRHLRRALQVLAHARQRAGRPTTTPLYEFTFVLAPNVASSGTALRTENEGVRF